jgi:2-polyprenyl-3-methyl-5-hydroxy-6-metoxy-1,4-benzoquinol methylase
MTHKSIGLEYHSAMLSCGHAYLLPVVDSEIARLKPIRIFDLGCGNGSVADALSKYCPVIGVDPSDTAVEQARTNYPRLRIEKGSAYDDLARKFGRFPVVISLEVVEHLYDPRLYARHLFDLLESGGTLILSTPYHGYLKNVVLALGGKMDQHFNPLWDGGHIKFWSIRTLTTLLSEVGFVDIEFRRVGRIPPLAKAMIAIARRAA